MAIRTIRTIPTRFDGYRFRSRTEARYAVMFRALRWRYEFEMQGFSLSVGAYLPDFWLPDLAAWIEVKPFEPSDADHALCAALADETGNEVMALCGTPWWDAEAVLYKPQQNLFLSTLSDFLRSRGLSKEEVGFAFTAAREARFEHGETPLIAA